ncbi:WLM domain-containing protein [Rhizoctonia solani]|nr:WLM domain-containing protein [Rhizoctonia solani]
MPLHRLNTKTSSPNPYFNFITVLPSFINAPGIPSQDEAQKLLQALAAQVRPVCKKHGFNVNSFEEYEYNTVFLGRNWNAGETIEIVLRRSDGSFHNIQHLIQVVCHELAHIKHMNHLAEFQQLNAQLCHEVAALRTKGYYGDGLYSSGTRLSDSAEVAGLGLGASDFDLPEYMCGGAQERRRASTLRRAPRQGAAPKQKRRKAGTRVTSKYAFVGQGNTLNSHAAGEDKKKGTGFGKRTQSAKERQARLEATERRLKNLERISKTKPVPESEPEPEPDSDSDSGSEAFKETDELRRKLLEDSGAGWKFSTFLDAGSNASFDDDIINLISDDERPSSSRPKTPPQSKLTLPKNPAPQKPGSSLTNMVRNEVEHRKREQLGLVGAQKLGGVKPGARRSRLLDTAKAPQPSKPSNKCLEDRATSGPANEWACLVCTCLNHEDYGACQACSTQRGCDAFMSV